MARRYRVPAPPRTENPALNVWIQQITDALNGIPAFSIFSGDPNASGISAAGGTLGINIASGQSKLYVMRSDGTNSWDTVI